MNPVPPFAIGFVLGSIPFGLLLTRSAGLGDIRAIGSGSIGATNVLRTGRRGLALATVLLDGGKGAAAVLIAAWLLGDPRAGLIAGFAAVLGHIFPPWLAFRGGKGVATGFGVLFAAAWPVGLAAGAVWIAVAAVSRISSASALAAFAAAPLLGWVFAGRDVAVLALAIAVLVWVAHRGNIARLLAGTEPRIGART
jgi:glycerol-3-phosphate acyltransferase PlsY